MTKFVCISDTHENHEKIIVPECDILIHAGDISKLGSRTGIRKFAEWFAKQPAKHKVVIAGNHDHGLQKYPEWGPNTFGGLGINYLNESGVTLEGYKIYGNPWTPKFGPWAFMAERGSMGLAERYNKIPNDTDILVCHGPPWGILDQNSFGLHCGCELMAARVKQLKLKMMVYGHIHECGGLHTFVDGTLFVNAAQVNLLHQVVNQPVVIDSEK
jgi:Icc-related predicted phosphoesterase